MLSIKLGITFKVKLENIKLRMANTALEFFIYNHEERDFDYFEENKSTLVDIMSAENPAAVAEELENENIDGILVLDESAGRWYLGFATSVGIVAQRTARRQADSIVRSGYTLPDGYWLKANYPLEELSDPDIGDLWKTVQEKYVKDSSLTGMDFDKETGIPSQLAERAKRLQKEGISDELAEAKFEIEEAKARAKAAEKSSKKISKKKKATKKQTTTKKKAGKKKSTKKATTKKKTKKSQSKADALKFLEIKTIVEYVHDGHTRIVAKGSLTEGTNDPEDNSVIFDQRKVSSKKWNDIAIFLSEGDIVQLVTVDNDDSIFATDLEV